MLSILNFSTTEKKTFIENLKIKYSIYYFILIASVFIHDKCNFRFFFLCLKYV